MKRVDRVHPGVHVDVHGVQVLPLLGQPVKFDVNEVCLYKEDLKF